MSDLKAANKKVLAMVFVANVAGVVNGYFLVVTGVTDNVGPMTTALVGILFGTPVFWLFFKPSLRSSWSVWKPSILLGISLGVNNLAYQCALRWVRLQVLEPVLFFFSAIFLVRREAVRDARNGKYSTALLPVLALLGIWGLVNDTADDSGGGAFTDVVPQVHVLGWSIPDWGLSSIVMILSSFTYAFSQRQAEVLKKDVGKVTTLSGLPALVILAVGAWTLEGGWSGVTGGHWPYLLVAAGSGMFLALFSGVPMAMGYADGLKASTTAMLLPFRVLLGTSLGMVVAQIAPGPLGFAAIGLILVVSCGAAAIQSRKDGSD